MTSSSGCSNTRGSLNSRSSAVHRCVNVLNTPLLTLKLISVHHRLQHALDVYDLAFALDYLHQCELLVFSILLQGLTEFQPFKYGFDSLMTNEFRTVNGTCNNLVPQGPGYEGVSLSNQVCTTVGALPGQPTVQGSRFVELSFGYSYNHLWRVSLPFFLGLMLAAYQN